MSVVVGSILAPAYDAYLNIGHTLVIIWYVHPNLSAHVGCIVNVFVLFMVACLWGHTRYEHGTLCDSHWILHIHYKAIVAYLFICLAYMTDV